MRSLDYTYYVMLCYSAHHDRSAILLSLHNLLSYSYSFQVNGVKEESVEKVEEEAKPSVEKEDES